MPAAKRPASSSPPPAPEAKKLHREDAGTIAECDRDPISAGHQGDMSASGLDDGLAISRATSVSPLLSPSQEAGKDDGDEATTIAEAGDEALCEELEGLGMSDEEELTGRCSQSPKPGAGPSRDCRSGFPLMTYSEADTELQYRGLGQARTRHPVRHLPVIGGRGGNNQ